MTLSVEASKVLADQLMENGATHVTYNLIDTRHREKS